MADQDVLARVSASAARRGFAVFVLGVLGSLLIYLNFTNPPAAFGWQLFLFLFGVFAIWAAVILARATQHSIELTQDELRESTGRVICKVADIAEIDRGVFAMKPSNGFMIRIKNSDKATWAPGLWWRFAGRIGVGGVTAANQAKGMSEIIATILAQRENDGSV